MKLPQQPSYSCGLARVPLIFKTVGQVIEEAALKWTDEIFIVSMHQDLEKTFRQVNEDANRLAAALLSIGVKKGDRVGIWSPNNYEWVVTQFGTAKIGAILVNVNPAYRVNEFVYCANLVGLSTLISCQKFKTSNYAEILESASPGIFDSSSTGIGVTSKTLPSLKNVIFIDEVENDVAPASVIRFAKFLEGQSVACPKVSWHIDPDEVINIQFTSGTTGSPKGAQLTHHGIVNNGYMALREYIDSSSVCVPNPLYHCFGCVGGTLASAVMGNKVVLPSVGFSSAASLASIEKYKCRTVFGTPTMFIDYIREAKAYEAKTGKKYDLSSIEYGCIGGSPCPEKLVDEARNNLFPNLKQILIPYGSTEVSPVITLARMSTPQKHIPTTVGEAIDHVEIKIVNPETGIILPRGETGELWTRSVFVFRGYWNQPEMTAEVVDECGWYKTGDLASMNEDSCISINGRTKDMIIRGGENIYPREIEELLMCHEAILDVNVVGISDERMGEEVAACVILKNGFTASDDLKESIKCFCKEKIAHYKIPRYVLFVQDYPRTVTLKVQKNKLRSLAESMVNTVQEVNNN